MGLVLAPEVIVKEYTKESILDDMDNMLFLHRDNYYKLSDDEEDVINIVFNDGYHGKSKRYIDCKINRETGRLFDV